MHSNNRQQNNQRRLEIARRLHAAGVPLEIREDAGAEGLSMSQIGGPLETCAFGLSYGGAGYLVSLSVTVNCPVLAIENFELGLPWNDPSIQWLEDPRAASDYSNTYRFPGRNPLEYDRDLVINHFAGLKREFRRGQSFQGFLMGVGSPLPDDLRHGPVPAFVAIVDQFGQRCSSPIELFVDRTPKHSTVNQIRSSRGPLFSRRDDVKSIRA